MDYKYAQLDKNGTVEGISFLAGPVSAPNMVLLDGSRQNDDLADLGWRLCGGQWLEPEPIPAPVWVEPVSTDELKDYQLLNMELTLGLIEMLSEGGVIND